jgi:hypothetical protein
LEPVLSPLVLKALNDLTAKGIEAKIIDPKGFILWMRRLSLNASKKQFGWLFYDVDMPVAA